MLHAETQGDQGFVEKREEFIQCGKITVQFSLLFFAKSLESLCDTENFELFGDLRTLQITVSNGLIIPSY